MTKALGAVVMAAALTLSAAAQDAEKKTHAEGEAHDLLKAGLEASQKAGGFKVEGRVDQENGMGGMKIAGLGDGALEGKFTGSVGADGTIAIKLETSKGTYELFKKGGKVVQRQTWTGKQETVGAFAEEITSLLNLARLAKEAGRLKAVRLGEAKQVGGVDCSPLKAKLSNDVIAEEEDDDDSGMPGMKMKLFELKKVDATVFVGKEDRLVRRIDVKLSKGPSAMIKMAARGMGGDEEDEEKKDEKKKGDEDEDEDDDGGMPGGAMLKSSTSYSVTIGGYDKELKVAIPEDVKRHFGE